MSVFTIILIVIVAFLAGMEGVLDQWQFHQPLVACTLIGLVSGYLEAGIILGGTLQMMALGWANVGAAVAPDAALASVASAILMVIALIGGSDQGTAISTAIAVAVPLSVAGLFLTMIVRTIAIPIVHIMDGAAARADYTALDVWSIIAICLQGIRIAIPAAALCFIPSEAVMGALNMMPAWLNEGMTIGGGMVAAVGYAMVINMMATKEVWPFFALGFCLAAISQLTRWASASPPSPSSPSSPSASSASPWPSSTWASRRSPSPVPALLARATRSATSWTTTSRKGGEA